MKRGIRNRGGEADEAIETIKAQAEQWVAQTRREFVEARAKLDAELEQQRARHAEVERRLAAAEARVAELEQEGVAARKRAERAERSLEEVRGQASRPPEEGRAKDGPVSARGRVLAWAEVKALAQQGHSQREIARRLGLNRRTVARLIASDNPPRYRRRSKGSMLDPLEPTMRAVLREFPGIDAPGMTEVLREHGYRGSVDLVRRRLQVLRGRG